MAKHNLLGKEGEALAAAWLVQKGYTILHQNWRHSHYELDIVATKGIRLHFIEVKMRSSGRFGYPEDGVSKKKFRRLLEAADEFLHQHPGYRHVQYDVLAIQSQPNAAPEYFLIEDVWL